MEFNEMYPELVTASKKFHEEKNKEKNNIQNKPLPETETNYLNRYRTIPKTGNITNLKI